MLAPGRTGVKAAPGVTAGVAIEGGVAAEMVGPGVGDAGLAIAVGVASAGGFVMAVGVAGAAAGAQLDNTSNATPKLMPTAVVFRTYIEFLLFKREVFLDLMVRE